MTKVLPAILPRCSRRSSSRVASITPRPVAYSRHKAGRAGPAACLQGVMRTLIICFCIRLAVSGDAQWTWQGLIRSGPMQVMMHTCYTGRREAFVLAVLIEPPADQHAVM